jgi:glucosamine--fructose-6-phosphate aminotransferase (isomerizing)
MNARRAKVIGVTNWADSPLAREADFAVMTAAGDEYTVSCKTYVATQMALRMLGAVLGGADIEVRLRNMEPAAEVSRDYLRGWKRYVDELIELLSGVRDVFLVGRGESQAAAQTGALTIKESTHFHAEGMSSAAFRHGPFEMLKEGILVGVFAGDVKTRELNERLVKDVSGTAARAVLFANDAAGVCRLPAVAEPLRTVVEVLPVQMMTLALAALGGREAGKFERATKVTAVE